MSEHVPPRILCVRIKGTEAAIRAFLSRHPMETYALKREGDEVSVEVFVPPAAVDEIKRHNLGAEVLYDASAQGKERQKEVGQGNRFKEGQKIPKGLGGKTKGEPR